MSAAASEKTTRRRPPGKGRLQAAVDVSAMRAALSVTQERLARLLGVTFQSVNGWECGRVAPTGVGGLLLPLLVSAVERMGGARVYRALAQRRVQKLGRAAHRVAIVRELVRLGGDA